MSQNPYAQMGQPMGHEPMRTSAPASTSVLAVIALICAIIPCPGLGLLGLILGIIAVFVIASSNGRKKGKGLAVAAILIGLVLSTAYAVAGVGLVRSGLRQRQHVQEPMYSALRKLEAGDVSEFRAMLAPTLAANITDDEILAFRDAYVASSGSLKGEPQDFGSVMAIAAVSSDISLMQRTQTATGKQPIPVPAEFMNGGGAIIVVSDSVANQFDFMFKVPQFKGTVVNVAVAAQNATPAVLTEFIGKAPGGTNPGGTPTPASESPEQPSAAPPTGG